jgi:hypothetical protein
MASYTRQIQDIRDERKPLPQRLLFKAKQAVQRGTPPPLPPRENYTKLRAAANDLFNVREAILYFPPHSIMTTDLLDAFDYLIGMSKLSKVTLFTSRIVLFELMKLQKRNETQRLDDRRFGVEARAFKVREKNVTWDDAGLVENLQTMG